MCHQRPAATAAAAAAASGGEEKGDHSFDKVIVGWRLL